MKPIKISTAPEKPHGTDKHPANTKEENVPNANTLAAMEELKDGKGRKFKSVAHLFKSI
jgi:hypothetical protein